MSEIAELQRLIDNSNKIVFFGGAGVSTESGIPDFRSVDGLYNQKYDYPPEEILSHTFFERNTEEFYRFYRDKMLCLDKKPNKAHLKLAELEKAGKLSAVVTQNMHGSVLRNYCRKCRKFYTAEYIKKSEGVPKCECGGVIKPDVVLYEEGLDDSVVSGALNAIMQADLLIIAGTSLTVYPAAGFIRYFRGDKIVLINRDSTPFDSQADLVFHDKVGELLDKINVPSAR